MINYIILIFIIVIITITYYIWKKLLLLRKTWNQHKSNTYDTNQKIDHVISQNNEIINFIKRKFGIIDEKISTIEKNIDSIKYELLLNHFNNIAKNSKDMNKISKSELQNILKIINNYKVDNKINELKKKLK